MRIAERCLPQGVFRLSLWPIAVLVGLVEIGKIKRTAVAWRRINAALNAPGTAELFAWHGIVAPHARFVYLFPDRLSKPGWRQCCCFSGATDLDQLRASKRRVVFASLHFGPFETLVYWLRARGWPVTVLVGRPAPRQALKRRQYSLSPPANVPVVLPVGELRRLREARQTVQHLLVMMDVERGHQVELEKDQLVYRLAAGPIRLADMMDAILVPCLTTVQPGWSFTIHFGRPVPARERHAKADLEAIARHLLEDFLPIVRQHPEQCGPRLLSCVRPAKQLLEPSFAA